MTPSAAARSTRAQLVSEFDSDFSIDSLLDSMVLPPDRLAALQELAAPEDWGDKGAVLLRYLAAHIPLAIEQERYLWDGKRLVTRAGHLATDRGVALYLGLARADKDRWALDWSGERPTSVAPMQPPHLGTWPTLDVRREVVLAIDRFPSPVLAKLPSVAQQATVVGATVWALRHELAVRQLRGEHRGYWVPLHLTDRTGAPEVAAAIQVQGDRLVVRALLEPAAAYGTARVAAEQIGMLPTWLVEAWQRREHSR